MQSLITKLGVMIAAILFFCCMLIFGIHLTPYSSDNGASPIFLLGDYNTIGMVIAALGGLGYLTVILLPNRKAGTKSKFWPKAFWIITLIISVPFVMTKVLFGNNDIEPILIFLRDNQMDDMLTIGIDGFTKPIKSWTLLILTIVASSFILTHYKKHFEKILVIFSVGMLAISPLAQYIRTTLFPTAEHRDFVIEDRMYVPEVLQKPSKQKKYGHRLS